jgi:hypothetical protein
MFAVESSSLYIIYTVSSYRVYVTTLFILLSCGKYGIARSRSLSPNIAHTSRNLVRHPLCVLACPLCHLNRSSSLVFSLIFSHPLVFNLLASQGLSYAIPPNSIAITNSVPIARAARLLSGVRGFFAGHCPRKVGATRDRPRGSIST